MRAAGSERFAALDLLRGIAALSVLVFHLPFPGQFAALPRGYLAVDLFFLLSGFVIAHAYSSRLGTPAQLRQFCLARLIRLYPIYAVGTAMGAAYMLAFAIFGGGAEDPNITAGKFMATLATAVLFLPTPTGWSVSPGRLFPFVLTAWSLFWELCVNLIYGIASTWLRPGLLVLPIAIGGVGLLFAEQQYGIRSADSGLFGDMVAGFARALFSFFAGVALFQVRKRHRAPAVPATALAALLLIALSPWPFGGRAYDIACIALLFPLLVWFGADATMGPQVRSAGNFLGFLSYPVYILQAPLLLVVASLAVRLERVVATGGYVQPVMDLVVILLVSWLVARWFDAPVRDWLRRRLVPQAPVPQGQTAP
jgi:peptidoglycan/LPS O-acetylase OafA/YrhL